MKFKRLRELGPNVKRIRRWRWGKPHCYWCGRAVSYRHRRNGQQWVYKPTSATREHLIPKSKGGAKGHSNIVVACAECNHRRGSDISWVPFHRRAAEVVSYYSR